ncbi:MAG: hypothetical protein WCP11_01075 [Candidatus Saccharibacteria bacterium]
MNNFETINDKYNKNPELTAHDSEGAELKNQNLQEQDIKSPDADQARLDIEKTLLASEKNSKEAEKQGNHATTSRRGPISKQQLNNSYKKTLGNAQNSLSPISRLFSKAIHSQVIEKTSEIAGKTIARPNSILFGSFTAFILTLVLYLIAKNMGYPLSGFETIAAFIIGWILGIIFDYLRVTITGKD